MSWLPMALGAMLGLGALLVFQAVGMLRKKDADDAARRRGFWRLNAGLVLIAVSMFVFARTGGA
ncbi:MAG: hypothetical protein GEU92_07890 [Alphaproteobacteria bacterium]|nr:hypothetical protein [Alphaproteobacteria bacterium]